MRVQKSSRKSDVSYTNMFAIVPVSILLLISAIGVTGCVTTKENVEIMTVEGSISVFGNEPFTAVILETDARNRYILKMSPEMRARLATPSYRRVTGRLYLGQWNGRDFAHLDVHRIEGLPEPQ